jgi:DNA-binding MarR family transcriptional regulator
VVAVLNRLEEHGLAVREPDEHDRRRNAITITPAGQRALSALETQVEQAQEDLLKSLSADQREQLLRLLQQLLDHHYRQPPAPPARPHNHDGPPARHD